MTKVLLLSLALGRGGCTSTIAARELVPIKGIFVRSHPAGLSINAPFVAATIIFCTGSCT